MYHQWTREGVRVDFEDERMPTDKCSRCGTTLGSARREKHGMSCPGTPRAVVVERIAAILLDGPQSRQECAAEVMREMGYERGTRFNQIGSKMIAEFAARAVLRFNPNIEVDEYGRS